MLDLLISFILCVIIRNDMIGKKHDLPSTVGCLLSYIMRFPSCNHAQSFFTKQAEISFQPSITKLFQYKKRSKQCHTSWFSNTQFLHLHPTCPPQTPKKYCKRQRGILNRPTDRPTNQPTHPAHRLPVAVLSVLGAGAELVGQHSLRYDGCPGHSSTTRPGEEGEKGTAWIQIFFQIFFIHLYLGRWSNLTNISQMGWNHQLGEVFLHALPETNVAPEHLAQKERIVSEPSFW